MAHVSTEPLMNNDTYLRLILEFSSSRELITTVILLSKYHYDYIHSAKHCQQLIHRILRREFGCVISTEASDPIHIIQTTHNYWDDSRVESNLNFVDRLMSHYKQWTVYGLRHFMTQISKKEDIAIHLLSFDTVCERFEPLQLEQHRNHIIHLLWEQTLRTIRNVRGDDDDEWIIDDDVDGDDAAEKLYLIQPQLENYLSIVFWMNQHKEYALNQDDILTFYRVFPFVNNRIQQQMLEMIVTPETFMTMIFSFLLDIVEPQRPISVQHLYGDFRRVWPASSTPFVEYLLPAIIRYAVRGAQIVNEDAADVDSEAVSWRWAMSDIIMEIGDIIGQNKVYHVLYELLSVDDAAVDCRYYEAVLFCIATHSKVVASAADKKEQHPLYKIFVKILDLQAVQKNAMVWNRAIYLFGHHCGFLGGNDFVLKQYFDRFIVGSLTQNGYDSQTKSFAANAFKRFCDEYRGKCIPPTYVQTMYNIYVHSCAVSQCDEERGRRINIKQEISIIIGLSTILTGFEDRDDIENAINYLMQIPYHNLCILISNKQRTASSDHDGVTLVEMMKRISTIFKFFKLDYKHHKHNEIHLSLKNLLKMWPEISYLLVHHTNDDDVMEYAVRCLKHVMRECPADYKQCKLFVPVFQQMIDLYSNISQRSSFLYLMSIYLDEYRHNNAILQLFSASLHDICDATFKTVSNSENDEIIEDFYEMVKVYMRSDTKHIFEENMHCMKWIFGMGIDGLLVENVNAHIAVTTFYQQFFEINQNYPQNKYYVDQIYDEYGRDLLHQILCGLSGEIKFESRAKELAQLVHHLYIYNKSQCQLWMKQELPKINQQHNQLIDSFCSATSKRQRLRCLMDWYSKCKM